VFPTVDAPKGRHDNVLRLSTLAINGRKRSKNGVKTVCSTTTGECSLDQLRLSSWRNSTKDSLDMSELLVCSSNGQEFTPNARRAPIMGNGSENLLGDSGSESEAIAQGAPAERGLIHRLSAVILDRA
jgi:hypothetical protein